MTISINWATKVIYVPKADTTLIQLTPTEIRELNLNEFRLALKDLEDSIEGMAYSDTHRHNTEVEIAGIVFARVIEIINGYTVTFENGFYSVNLVGANSNVGDVINANNVSIRSANAAGLISNSAIEYSSFNGGVTVDTSSEFSGTVFPKGTPQQPVNNLADAMLIAEVRGFTTIYVIGDLTIDNGGDYRNMSFVGESVSRTILTISDSAMVEGSEFEEATITGVLDGNAKCINCRIMDINYIYGVIEQCLLGPGTITLGGENEAHFIDCWSGVIGEPAPIIDCGGAGQSLGIRNYNGLLKIKNLTGQNNHVSIDLNSGVIELDSTCTDGIIEIRGIGDIIDGSNGSTVIIENLVNNDHIAKAIMESVVEGTITFEQFIRIMGSVLAGKTTGGGTSTLKFRDIADAKDRVVATVDENSNRTGITLDGE